MLVNNETEGTQQAVGPFGLAGEACTFAQGVRLAGNDDKQVIGVVSNFVNIGNIPVSGPLDDLEGDDDDDDEGI